MRKSSTERGYGYRWQRTSKGYLAEHQLCVDPGNRHPDEVRLATQTDHIVPHRGDMKLFWDPKNWQGLCDSCHSYKTAVEDGGFGR
jgi:5-methylcytosine-specific restriction protein A